MSSEITRLLDDYPNGNRQALDELLPIVYSELRRLAHSYLGRERGGMTLQTTALVHEVYMKLIGQHSVDFRNRAQFFALSAQAMRRILLDNAAAVPRGSVETMAKCRWMTFPKYRSMWIGGSWISRSLGIWIGIPVCTRNVLRDQRPFTDGRKLQPSTKKRGFRKSFESPIFIGRDGEI